MCARERRQLTPRSRSERPYGSLQGAPVGSLVELFGCHIPSQGLRGVFTPRAREPVQRLGVHQPLRGADQDLHYLGPEISPQKG
jgi:hypothetical protein